MKNIFIIFGLCILFIINSVNANHTPSELKLSSNSVTENMPIGTLVGYLSATDLDIIDSHTFSLAIGNGINDADNSKFYINANKLYTNHVFDFEIQNTTNIYIKTIDTQGGILYSNVQIIITDQKSAKLTTKAWTLRSPIKSICQIQNQIWSSSICGIVKTGYSSEIQGYMYSSSGISDNNINQLFQDKNQNIWVATQNGLTKISPASKTQYNTTNGLPGNIINTIIEDNFGNIWIGTWGNGIAKLVNNQWVVYNTTHGLADDYVYSMFCDKDNKLWIGTANGLSLYDGLVWQTYKTANGLASNEIFHITTDKSGNIWISTWLGISKLENNIWKTYTQNNGLVNDFVFKSAADNDGSMWFVTLNGISKFKNNTFVNYNTTNGLPENEYQSICIDDNNVKWFGSSSGFLSKFDDYNWTHKLLSDPIADNTINSIASESNGNLWFASWNGISKYANNIWTNYTKEQGLSDNFVNNVFISQDNKKWFLTKKNVSIFENNSMSILTINTEITSNNVKCMTIDKSGIVWLGTRGGGIVKIENGLQTNYTIVQGLANNNVNCIITDKNNIKWIGTSQGISKLEGSVWKNYSVSDGLPANEIMAICEDTNGILWIGTWGGGIVKYDGQNWHIFNTSNGLISNNIYSIFEKNGYLIAGTSEGLSKYNGNGWYNYSVADGLTDKEIRTVYMTNESEFWLGTNTGIIFAKEFNNNPTDISITNSKIMENSNIGITIGYLTTTDLDGEDEFCYSLVKGNGANDIDNDKFYIQNNELKTGYTMDFELQSTFRIYVESNDKFGGHVQKSIELSIINTNDEKPIISPTTIVINENTQNNTHIGKITASENETGFELKYNIISTTLDALGMIESTGELTVKNSLLLDYENILSFNAIVQVSDGIYYDTTTITIQLNNINDNAPEGSTNNISIQENTKNNTTIGWLTAKDNDKQTFFEYSIPITTFHIPFYVIPTTGEIIVGNQDSIDYEKKNEYLIEYFIFDGIFTTKSICTVYVIDNNDFTPILPFSMYTINENTTSGATISQLSAYDLDENTTLTYSIVSGNIGNAFALNSTTGKLTVNQSLAIDYETQSSYHLMIKVSDGLNISQSKILIQIINQNDNYPLLENYTFNIFENSNSGTFIGKVFASDSDGNLNTLTYNLKSGNTGNAFTLDKNSGILKVLSSNILDYESKSIYDLVIDVTDAVYTTIANIKINIQNIDENTLNIFDNTIFVKENQKIHLTQIQATSISNILTYNITSGNVGNTFYINPITGDVSITATTYMDYEFYPEFTLDILATDGTNQKNAKLFIKLLDVDEATPYLISETFSVSEYSIIGTQVGTIVGYDDDVNLAKLKYNLISSTSPSTFSIDPPTGNIYLINNQEIDYEKNKLHTLLVQVSDGIHKLTEEIEIIIVNENDNIPKSYPKTININENLPNQTEITTIDATDNDGSLNTLIYNILAGNTNNIFVINTLNGRISINKSQFLDYEQIKSYKLTLEISDGTNNSETTLIININDINDNYPEISNKTLMIDENLFNNTTIFQFKASDADANSIFYYNIVGGNTNDAFGIENSTGIVYVKNSAKIDYETIRNFQIQISVNDGLNTSYSYLAVNLNNTNDNICNGKDTIISIDENYKYYSIFKLAVTDLDGNISTINYQIISGNEKNIFYIDTEGILNIKPNNNIDYETTKEFGLIIKISDGKYQDGISVKILINNLNDVAPTIENQTFVLQENSPKGTVVGVIKTIDADGKMNQNTFTISGGNTNNTFKINAQTGEIFVNNNEQLKYDIQNEYNLTITLNDGVYTTNNNVKINLLDVVENRINEMEFGMNLHIYPNPCEAQLNIFTKTNAKIKYEIISINGKILISNDFFHTENSTIDVTSLKNGFYILKLKINNSIVIRKIIVQK